MSGFDFFRDLLEIDPYFSSILDVFHVGKRMDFLLHDGFLFKGNQLCVPDCSLRLHIIQELHGEDLLGRYRTLQLARELYFWPSMRKEVKRFVERCRVYQVS